MIAQFSGLIVKRGFRETVSSYIFVGNLNVNEDGKAISFDRIQGFREKLCDTSDLDIVGGQVYDCSNGTG